MLSTVKLNAAGVYKSKNAYLNGLLQEIFDFNSLGTHGPAKLEKIKQLDRVTQVAGWYVTSKPPQPKDKNRRRWEAIHHLLNQCATEAAGLEVKQLTGPTDYRTIDNAHRSYWLEKLDPDHRPGYELAAKFAGWLTNGTCINNKTPFWNHIGTALPWDDKVSYYNEGGTPDQYEIHFDGIRLRDYMSGLFSTRTMSTAFSQTGWAIFVCSPNRRIFSNSHVVGKDHHSSFLDGGSVMAAGEICVDNGLPRIITAKSGHYKPTPETLRNFVRILRGLPSRGADPAGPVDQELLQGRRLPGQRPCGDSPDQGAGSQSPAALCPFDTGNGGGQHALISAARGPAIAGPSRSRGQVDRLRCLCQGSRSHLRDGAEPRPALPDRDCPR